MCKKVSNCSLRTGLLKIKKSHSAFTKNIRSAQSIVFGKEIKMLLFPETSTKIEVTYSPQQMLKPLTIDLPLSVFV